MATKTKPTNRLTRPDINGQGMVGASIQFPEMLNLDINDEKNEINRMILTENPQEKDSRWNREHVITKALQMGLRAMKAAREGRLTEKEFERITK